MDNVGFPDFEQPVFFSRTTLPFSNLDRVSARYEARALAPWFTNLKVTGYFQDQRRLLRTEFPVQFPVPSPAFFPINVFRLNLVSDSEQHVQTPGLDVQATFVPARGHLLTAGLMLYTDRSRDTRTSTSQSTIIGNVAMGARGPAPNVFSEPVVLGPASTTHPVRVPDSSFRDIGLFAQDEWSVTAALRLVAATPALRTMAAVSFVYAGLQMCVSGFIVAYLAEEIGLGLVTAGVGLTVANVAGVVARIGWGAFADRVLSPRSTLALLGGLMAVSSAVTAMFSAAWPLPALLAVVAVLGGTAIGWNGVYLAEAARVAPAGQAALATGGCLFFTYVGVVCCPFLFGLLQRASGSYALCFAVAAAAYAAVAAVLALRRPAAAT